MAVRDVRFTIRARDATQQAFQSVQARLIRLGRASLAFTATRIGGAVGVAASAVAALGANLAETGRELERLQNTAERVDIDVETLQEFQEVARTTGAGVNVLELALQRLVRRSQEAIDGNRRVAEAFADFGLSIEDLRRLEPGEIFLELADGVSTFEDRTKALERLIRLLDSEGARLFSTFNLGRAEIERIIQEFRDLGGVVEGEAVESLDEFSDSWDRFFQAQSDRITNLKADILGLIDAFETLSEPSQRPEDSAARDVVRLRRQIERTQQELEVARAFEQSARDLDRPGAAQATERRARLEERRVRLLERLERARTARDIERGEIVIQPGNVVTGGAPVPQLDTLLAQQKTAEATAASQRAESIALTNRIIEELQTANRTGRPAVLSK